MAKPPSSRYVSPSSETRSIAPFSKAEAELARQKDEARRHAENEQKRQAEEYSRKQAEADRARRQAEAQRVAEAKERRQQEEARQEAEAIQKRQIEKANRRAAEEERHRKRVAELQKGLIVLDFYKGPVDGEFGNYTRAAFKNWLGTTGLTDDEKLAEQHVELLRKQVQEEKHRQKVEAEKRRKEEDRRLAEAEMRRKEAEAREVALVAKLTIEAGSLTNDVQAFLRDQPNTRNMLEIVTAFSAVESALVESRSATLIASLRALRELMAESDDFKKFVALREEARQVAENAALAASTATLKKYHEFLTKHLTANLRSKSVRQLIPLIQETEDLLSSQQRNLIDQLVSKITGYIEGVPNLRQAYERHLAGAKAKAERLAEDSRENAEAKRVAKAEAQRKSQEEQKRRVDEADAGRRLALKEKHKYAVAVIIGNRNYTGKVPEVLFAHNDADAIRDYVSHELGYREGNILDFRDASQAELVAIFGNRESHKGRLYGYVRPGKSDVTVFYSGHGVPGLEDRKGYLLPSDADPNLIELNGYSVDVLFDNLSKIAAKSVTVFLDACFSGDTPQGMIVRAMSGVSVTPKFAETSSNVVVITAAKGDQVASWDEESKLGLFTKHLLTALHGQADGGEYGDGDGNITVAEVQRYLDDEMTYQARRRFNRDQQVSVQGNSKTVLATYR